MIQILVSTSPRQLLALEQSATAQVVSEEPTDISTLIAFLAPLANYLTGALKQPD